MGQGAPNKLAKPKRFFILAKVIVPPMKHLYSDPPGGRNFSAGRAWRVWLVGPPEGWISPGGGEVQWLATAQALQERGLEVSVVGGPIPPIYKQMFLQPESPPFRPTDEAPPAQSLFQPPRRPRSGRCRSAPFRADRPEPMAPPILPAIASKPDIVHLFGSHPSHLDWAAWARQAAVPVVLSPIAWFSLRTYWRAGGNALAKWTSSSKFLLRAVCPWLPSWRKRLYRSVDLLLPNSLAEARQLSRYFLLPPSRIHVVPNGADPRFAQAAPTAFVQRTGLHHFVFCPGRLEPRKNQLGLLRAMRDWPGPIVLMGDPAPGQEAYAAACRQEAGTNVHFLPRLAHDDPLLASAYAACGCVVLASWFETPGLAALEAAMQGAPLVLPTEGACQEYFGPWAWYVRPTDLAGIHQAVEKALQSGRNPRLAQHVLRHYTWQQTAEATWQAYRRAMNLCIHQGPPRSESIPSMTGPTCQHRQSDPNPAIHASIPAP